MMEKNENANKRQDFAEGIVAPETAKAAAGGVTSDGRMEYRFDRRSHPGKCPFCGYSSNGHFDTDNIQIPMGSGNYAVGTLCCNKRYDL